MFTPIPLMYNSDKKFSRGGIIMKKLFMIAGLTAIIGVSCGTSSNQAGLTPTEMKKEPFIKANFSKDEAKRIIQNYVKNAHMVSPKIKVYETNKYYVGEVFIKGYENFDVARKIYISKRDKSIVLPTMAETYDYSYMLNK